MSNGPSPQHIYHLAEPNDWEQARRDGRYTRSTRGLGLDEVGFIHASTAQQWPVVRESFYADVATDLVLLTLDEAVLESAGSSVVREVGDPGSGELFPHVYGPIPLEAVVSTQLLSPPHA